MSRLELPAAVLAGMTATYKRENPARAQIEVSGFLLARLADPGVIVAAVGPGRDAQHARNSTVSSLDQGMRDTARAAGLLVVGDWHLHDAPTDQLAPSTPDRAAWYRHLRYADQEVQDRHWLSLIAARDPDGGWAGWRAWETYLDGRFEPRPITPLDQLRDEAGALTWGVEQGCLTREWWSDPGALGGELLRLAADAHTRASVAAGQRRRNDARPPAAGGNVIRRATGTITRVY